MPALDAGSAYNECTQYTIRNIPAPLDAALRAAARAQGKSLNEVALTALIRGAGVDGKPRKLRDLSRFVGTWVEDPEFDKAIADQRRIDEELWR